MWGGGRIDLVECRMGCSAAVRRHTRWLKASTVNRQILRRWVVAEYFPSSRVNTGSPLLCVAGTSTAPLPLLLFIVYWCLLSVAGGSWVQCPFWWGRCHCKPLPPSPTPIYPESLRHGSSSEGCGGAKTACLAWMTLILLLMLCLKRIRRRDLN